MDQHVEPFDPLIGVHSTVHHHSNDQQDCLMSIEIVNGSYHNLYPIVNHNGTIVVAADIDDNGHAPIFRDLISQNNIVSSSKQNNWFRADN
ncbi:hypothetical protein BLOT_006936 [Blomia tropicalis]|nr:hypothetical protein BLOT_006936 [Blomia tropicalis]